MNDFTKEELILMACWSANRFEQLGPVQARDEGTIALSHKIQSMIDSYCEHEYENNCCGCELDFIMCQKCDRSVNE